MKKTLFKWLMALVAVVSVSAMQSCKDDGPDDNGGGLGKYDFTIAEDDLYHSVDKNGGQIEIDIQTSLPKTQWTVEYDANWLMAMQGSTIDGHASLTINVQPNSDNRREAVVKVSSLTRNYNITIRQYGVNGVEAEEDFQVKPTGATASSEQPGSGNIKYSYDDDPETMYHSHWTDTRMPVTLEYYFSGQESIDYIDYVPRMGGGNGAFGKLSVEVATNASRSNYQAIGDFDFQEQATSSRINLPESMKATGVKFIVKSGTGGFASCAEMKFWRRNTDRKLDKELLTVFTDLTCTELKPGVGPEEIGALSNEFFQDLAEIIRTDSYDPIEKLIRIHEYEPYSNPVEWAEKLMTKIYSNLDNPMGIHVTKGQTVILCVGPTHGHSVSVMCVGEHKASGSDDYAIPDASGPSYLLTEGVNVLTMTSDGQLFLMYTADPSQPKIKVHVPVGDNGRLAGYFDLKEHKTDEMYKKIVAKATHKYFVVKGERMMFMFHRNSLACSSMVSAIQTWDQFVKWQQDFMGIDDVRPSKWNNHLMGVSMEGAYMWASNWRMGFINTYLGNILEYNQLMAEEDNAWGPNHEMGHVNQLAINWISTTESSNNLFSNYVLHKLGKYKSRGKGLMYRHENMYRYNECWANFTWHDTGLYQGEDAELHMRMNWQLWNYYHRVLGDEKFFARVFQKMREVGLSEGEDPGRKQLEYAKACADAAGEDLTDFFEAWGFFRPITTTVEQYGTYTYRVTQTMINSAKSHMAQYPKPRHAFEYIEDRHASEFPTGDYRYSTVGDVGHYSTYAENKQLSGGISANINGRTVKINNGNEAVAFEVRTVGNDGSYGEIRWASNFLTFTVPSEVNISGTALYAVQADGQRRQLGKF